MTEQDSSDEAGRAGADRAGADGADRAGPDPARADGADRAARAGADRDRAGAQIGRLLTDLANDPTAPPSTVDALSVIRAARAAAAEASTGGGQLGEQVAGFDRHDPAQLAPVASSPASVLPASVPPSSGLAASLPPTVARFRPRRRTAVLTLVAAAVAGIAALVIPLSLSGGSSTTTSANSEHGAGPSNAGAAVDAPVQPTAAEAASGLVAPSASGGFAADSGTSVPGGAPAGSGLAAAAAGGDSSAGGFVAASAPCWPTLTEAVAVALVSALPAGAFDAPEPLSGGCAGLPVGGASLPGTVTGTVLNVRIAKVEPAACVHPDASNAEPCVRQPDGTYLITDGPGAPTVFAYSGGVEVTIGGAPDTGETSGLSPGQLTAAARAVVGALG